MQQFGDNGLFKKSKEAADTYKKAEEKEREKLDDLVDNWDDILSGTISGTTASEIKSQITGNEESPTRVLINEKGVVIPPKFRIAEDSGEKVEDGIVVIDPQGNEWVWIPCYISGGKGSGISNNIKFDRYAFNSEECIQNQMMSTEKDLDNSLKIMINEDAYFHEAMPEEQYEGVKRYGGFYIGRYEAGIGENGKLVIQKDKEVCTNITYSECVEKANELISADGSEHEKLDGNTVFTGLCSSYVWDTTLKFIEKQHPNFTLNSTNREGSLAGNYGSEIMNSGKTIAVCNIYDIGGNAWEYTTETFSRPWNITFRGSAYEKNQLQEGPSFRSANTGVAAEDVGFRLCLFVK